MRMSGDPGPSAERRSGRAALVPPSETLNADGLLLRRWRTGDASAVTSAVRESLPHLKQWMPWATEEYDRNASAEFIANSIRQWDDREAFNYGVYGAGRGVLGGVGLMTRQGPGILEIGYWVHVRHVRRGIATRAAAALTAAGLAVDGIDLIEIHHNVDNAASGAVPAKLGFTKLEERTTDSGERVVVWQLHAADFPRSGVPDALGQRRY